MISSVTLWLVVRCSVSVNAEVEIIIVCFVISSNNHRNRSLHTAELLNTIIMSRLLCAYCYSRHIFNHIKQATENTFLLLLL